LFKNRHGKSSGFSRRLSRVIAGIRHPDFFWRYPHPKFFPQPSLGFFMSELETFVAHDTAVARSARSVLVVLECLACDRSHLGREGNFCSARCRAWIDAGKQPYRPTAVKYTALKGAAMPIMGDGFAIKCAGCRQIFSSKGLRCCSPICEQNLRHQEDRLSTMAEVGIEPSEKRRCEAPGCSATIPRWTGVGKARREVRKDARFCTPKCAENARKAARCQNQENRSIEAKKPLQNMGLQ
jgi:hypothetical protein